MRPIITTNSKKRGWRLHYTGLTAGVVGLALCLAVLFIARPAAAQDFTFHVEPAAAFWVDKPQLDRFTPGFYFALRPGISLGHFVDLQWSYAMLVTPAGKNFSKIGAAHFALAGVRVRPLAGIQPQAEQLGGLFVDGNLGYVRTGELDRFGFDAGVGYNFQITSWLALGPVVRYGQVVQADNTDNQDPNDGHFLTVGIDIAFGPTHKEEMECEPNQSCPAAPECVQEKCVQAECVQEDCVQKTTGAVPCLVCPKGDRDRDGICDPYDRCPTQIGPATTLGCPIDPCHGPAMSLIVQFDQNSAAMPILQDEEPQTMDPVLDAVAAAIALDPSCRVCIIGYASEEGPPGHNQDLSSRRATAVQGYMIRRDLAESRMPTVGMGERCQLVPLSTHVLNRRVEFRRLKDGESCPTDCAE